MCSVIAYAQRNTTIPSKTPHRSRSVGSNLRCSDSAPDPVDGRATRALPAFASDITVPAGGERRGSGSSHLQAAHRSGGGSELIGFDPHPLQHRDKQIGQRVVVNRVERQVLAVLEAAAGK